MAISYLVLDDGTVFEGTSFGYEGDAFGEAVFTTCSGGYQEEITDPAFRGQILIFSYPLFGNCGWTEGCSQSSGIHVRGIVVRECCEDDDISEYYGGKSVRKQLIDNKIPAISGIDTRKLVIRIRENGTMMAAITCDESKVNTIIKKLKTMKMPENENLVSEVSVKKSERIDFKKKTDVAVIDCGTKNAVIDELGKRFNVIMFPYDVSAKEILSSGANAAVICGGPGNPKNLKSTTETVKEISSQMPILGINLGHLVVAEAFGAKIYKLKFGHRGENQPTRFEKVVYMTSQNHGYAVDDKSLKGTGLVADQINVNDGTIEGMKHTKLPIITCQYNLEGKPGPMDTAFIFDRFLEMAKGAKR